MSVPNNRDSVVIHSSNSYYPPAKFDQIIQSNCNYPILLIAARNNHWYITAAVAIGLSQCFIKRFTNRGFVALNFDMDTVKANNVWAVWASTILHAPRQRNAKGFTQFFGSLTLATGPFSFRLKARHC